jgi:hypothetical protein
LEEHVPSLFRVEEEAKNQYEAGSKQLTLNRLHSIVCQKTELFITTTVRNSSTTKSKALIFLE